MNKEENISDFEDEEEIDLKEIFGTLKRYYKSLLAVTFAVTVMALVYAYFATNIYQASMMVKLPDEKRSSGNEFMAMAMGTSGSSSISDEIAIFQTRRLAEKALQDLNLGIRYFSTQKLKSYELYKAAPFVVIYKYLAPQIMGMHIKLIPAAEGQFRLVIKPTLKEKALYALRSLFTQVPEEERPIRYNKLHLFGEAVETPWFTVKVQQLHELTNDSYEFSMVPNVLMADFLLGELSVAPNSKDGTIIMLSVQDNVPLRAQEILNALSKAYLQENLQINSQSANKKLAFIDLQLEAINKTLAGSAESLKSYKATNIVIDLSTKAGLAAGKLSELESQLYELNMQIDVMENILSYIKTHEDLKGITVGTSQQSTMLIESIILEIQRVTAERSNIIMSYTKMHPDFIRIERQLAALRSSLNEAVKSLLRTLKDRKYSLNAIIEKSKRKMQTLPEQERNLAELTRNFMVNEKIYSYLLEKRAETAIVESSTVSETRIIESPVIGEFPVKPKRALIAVLGLVIGLILGIAQAMLRAYLDNTVKRVEDIEKLTKIPIYGAVPFISSRKDVQHYKEAFGVLWTNLEFSQEGDYKLVTVASSISGEGKTTIVANLGKTIANSGKRAIVLDLDMRRPTLHEELKVPNEHGMSTLLSGKSKLIDSIKQTEHKNFHVITAGITPPNPTALIMSPALPKIVKALSKAYDYIIFDSPPIGLVADAMGLMRMSDITLILLKANYSKKDFIKNINRFTSDENINAGIVLNGMQFGKNHGYGYGYGYGYETKGGTDYYS